MHFKGSIYTISSSVAISLIYRKSLCFTYDSALRYLLCPVKPKLKKILGAISLNMQLVLRTFGSLRKRAHT